MVQAGGSTDTDDGHHTPVSSLAVLQKQQGNVSSKYRRLCKDFHRRCFGKFYEICVGSGETFSGLRHVWKVNIGPSSSFACKKCFQERFIFTSAF